VVAALCSFSRERAKEAIVSSFVELNYECEERVDREISTPAVVSVRGVGKFNVISLSDKTKKGRYRLLAEKLL
jgi:RNA-binding protein YlmH